MAGLTEKDAARGEAYSDTEAPPHSKPPPSNPNYRDTPRRTVAPTSGMIDALGAQTPETLLLKLLGLEGKDEFRLVWRMMVCSSNQKTFNTDFVNFIFKTLERSQAVTCKIVANRYIIDLEQSQANRTLLRTEPVFLARKAYKETETVSLPLLEAPLEEDKTPREGAVSRNYVKTPTEKIVAMGGGMVEIPCFEALKSLSPLLVQSIDPDGELVKKL